MMRLILTALIVLYAGLSFGATSDNFPLITSAPSITSYFADGSANHTYYIATTGSDSTGTGSIGSPWATINGARTGGAGTAVAAGDLVYFRGGTYTNTSGDRDWKYSTQYINIDGTSSDYIVFAAYTGETPIFASTADGASMSIEGDYIVLNGVTFSTGSLTLIGGAHDVVQNCNFDGAPVYNSDQINYLHLTISDNAHYSMIRNNYFESTNAHAIKSYSSSNMPTNLTIEYNVFNGGTVSYGLVSFKSAISNFVIRYNRFQSVSSSAIEIGASYSGDHDGFDIYGNVFDGCTGSILTKLGTSTTGEVQNLNFYNNVIYNAGSGNRVVLELDCDDGCLSGATHSLGEFYSNVFYSVVDVIDPETTTEFVNYPDYFNYNAYPSTTIRDTAENENSVASSSWQGSALIQASSGITRTGSSGNYFYTIEDTNGFVGAGRSGGNIGGFTFGGAQAPGDSPLGGNSHMLNIGSGGSTINFN